MSAVVGAFCSVLAFEWGVRVHNRTSTVAPRTVAHRTARTRTQLRHLYDSRTRTNLQSCISWYLYNSVMYPYVLRVITGSYSCPFQSVSPNVVAVGCRWLMAANLSPR